MADEKTTCAEAGRRGGAALKKQMALSDPLYYKRIGRHGGQVNAQRHDKKYFHELAAKMAEARRRKRALKQDDEQ